MKPTLSPQDEKIIELLKRLGTLKAEYPVELLAARRAAFVAQIEQHNEVGADSELSSSQDQILELLEGLKPLAPDYPPGLLAARRAAFIAQIDNYNHADAQKEEPSQDPVVALLESLKPATAAYPADLFAARRAAFISQVERYTGAVAQEEQSVAQDGRLLRLLDRLKALEIEYPLKLWSARRSGFVTQVRDGKTSILDALRSAIRDLFSRPRYAPSAPTPSFRRTSLVLTGMLIAALMGSVLYENRQPLTVLLQPTPSQSEVSPLGPAAEITATGETAQVICKPGYLPPLCLAKEFDKSRDLTFPGNGSARPAVAKDTIPGYSRIHQPAYVNDGLYGPGASWISNSAYSWIKIDLGEVKRINTITFGRDRLGNFNDGDPGQFIIAVAINDHVYADGDSSDDFMEYTQVYNSDETGFDGVVSGPETIQANFEPALARFVKITFENPRTAVDEIEVFMIQPPGYAVATSTHRPRDTVAASTFTSMPTNTLVPSKTLTAIPTNTFIPTRTSTPRPTWTPRPTNTDVPTITPRPPTDTPIPPTDTPEPPTDTPVSPTDTTEPPTNTPEPPTNTPESPTDTSEPPTATSEPQLSITQTPEVVLEP